MFIIRETPVPKIMINNENIGEVRKIKYRAEFKMWVARDPVGTEAHHFKVFEYVMM